MKTALSICVFMLSALVGLSQATIKGSVTDDHGAGLQSAEIIVSGTALLTYSDKHGDFRFNDVPLGTYQVIAYVEGYAARTQSAELTYKGQKLELDFTLEFLHHDLDGIVLIEEKGTEETFGISTMHKVDDGAIYAGKKSEVLSPEHQCTNKSTANARQTYAKVAGLNVWENDGVGLQLGIGGRGLNPNRVSNFNTRQNGYDISADALGYPESYYSPPIEAVDRIEILRGAASLQYGTQFGGMINYRLRNGADAKGPIVMSASQTIGSFGYYHTFNSFAGKSDKIKYYGYVHHKHGNGWRDNSQFDLNGAYASAQWQTTEKLSLGFDYTFMTYLAQQPGGLTDFQFEQDPRQSVRARNWFRVNWNLAAIKADYALSDKASINARVFGLLAARDALGNRQAVSRVDHGLERDYLRNEFGNVGGEVRYLQRYTLFGKNTTLLTGARFYKGHTSRIEGLGTAASDADFTFLDADDPAYSLYDFPSMNVSAFTEQLIYLTDEITLTPGLRYEWIDTRANGHYNTRVTDLAGNLLLDTQTQDVRTNARGFLLGGLGLSYTKEELFEAYANASQNYRSINFNDMREANPNFQVDPELEDETGYTLDLGIRGRRKDWLYYDITAFMLSYNDRIGNVLQQDSVRFTTYRLRTNIADSRTVGLESFAEVDVLRAASNYDGKWRASIYSNLAFMHSAYINSEEAAYEGKKVELVPTIIWKSGATLKHEGFSTMFQFAYTGDHFTDATNATYSADGIHGVIPAYYVMDWSIAYDWDHLEISGSINNLTNNAYFTRRAAGYPGPGIIPSDGRAFYVTLGYSL